MYKMSRSFCNVKINIGLSDGNVAGSTRVQNSGIVIVLMIELTLWLYAIGTVTIPIG